MHQWYALSRFSQCFAHTGEAGSVFAGQNAVLKTCPTWNCWQKVAIANERQRFQPQTPFQWESPEPAMFAMNSLSSKDSRIENHSTCYGPCFSLLPSPTTNHESELDPQKLKNLSLQTLGIKNGACRNIEPLKIPENHWKSWRKIKTMVNSIRQLLCLLAASFRARRSPLPSMFIEVVEDWIQRYYRPRTRTRPAACVQCGSSSGIPQLSFSVLS